MKILASLGASLIPLLLCLPACETAPGGPAPLPDLLGWTPPSPDMGTSMGADLSFPPNMDACKLMDNTAPTGTRSPMGCDILRRDTTSCEAARRAAGLSGHWLKFSCRVTLSVAAGAVQAQADGQPDYKSNYFQRTNPCWEAYTGSIQNPNFIVTKGYTIGFPLQPDMTTRRMMGAIVGLALNGVPIFGNFAAPQDDIYEEARTFDKCGAHPQMTGVYHYHSEPYSVSYDDASFIGVMRDGYPIYGRKDQDGSQPALDMYGGHTGTTPDSATPVYHYHANEQTSANPRTLGQKQWFLTTGNYRGTPSLTCTGC